MDSNVAPTAFAFSKCSFAVTLPFVSIQPSKTAILVLIFILLSLYVHSPNCCVACCSSLIFFLPSLLLENSSSLLLPALFLCLCVCLCTTCITGVAEEDVRFSSIGFKDGYKLLCGYWESSLDPKLVLLTFESLLQTLVFCPHFRKPFLILSILHYSWFFVCLF